MKSLRFSPVVFAVLLSLFFASELFAAIDPQAPVVKLRTTCQEGAVTLDNCFTTMPDLLTWTYGTRLPSASLPLLVEIGPGSFGGFSCNASGYITLSGAGRKNTVLGGTVVGVNGGGPGCTQLVFQDLSITNITGTALTWWGSGSASYSNVELTGSDFAWWDYRFGAATASQQYWWNSVLNSTSGAGKATFQTYGAIHRFYGGEVNLKATGGDASSPASAVHVNAAGGVPGDIEIYGSAVHSTASPGATLSALVGAQVDIGQTFHMHGGSIGVDATAAGSTSVNVTGINAGGDGSTIVHVLETAFALKPKGTGTASRLIGAAPGIGVASPFLWANGPTPPAISSQNGADLFVQTNCAATGCQNTGTETHLLIYNNSCTGAGGPWFDVVTHSCR
ncbi:MAG: hypothetical protein ACYDC8_14140 [Gammaproteobacteria bacterium]